MFPNDRIPEDDAIVLQLRDERGAVKAEVDTFAEYSFSNHFLTPTDHFSFVIGDERLVGSIRDGIYQGQQVTLSVNGYVQAGGYINRVKVKSSRNAGTELHIDGRDWISPAVDAGMDPQHVAFNDSQSLAEVLATCFAPWWPGIGQIVTDDDANANIITGQHRGTPTSKKGKPLKSYATHRIKPYPHEGVFQFASRISQRFGLWIWPSADGASVIVQKPDFDQRPIYQIVHKTSDTSRNNVLEGEADIGDDNQPTVIVATGSGGGGEYSRSGLKVCAVNELTGLDESYLVRPKVQAILSANPDSVVLPWRSELQSAIRMPYSTVRASYMHDDESKTTEQLENFVRRELALRQHSAVVARYTFDGHTMRGTVPGKGTPFYTNSIANVDDDVNDIHGRMWCLSRTYTKSRGGGTRTMTEWIQPHTLYFG